MSINAGVGMSQHHNPNVAGREAAQQALEKAGISKPEFVFMFASIGYDQHSLLQAVREATGGTPLTGCSAAGTINGDDADESNFSIVVTVISSDELHWTNGIATGLADDPGTVGKQVAEELLPHLSAETIGLFVFPDGGLTENFDRFFAGLEENLQATNSSRSGVVARATDTSMQRRLPFSTVTTRSSPMGSPMRCSRARRKLPGPSAIA